jgi:predicted MFS family arabinose efflux permease
MNSRWELEWRTRARGDDVSSVALWCIGFTGLALEPFWIGGIVDHLGVRASLAGQFGALQLGCTGVVSLLVAPRIGEWSRRRISVIGLAVTFLGSLYVSIFPTVSSVLVSRVLVGLGEGATLAVAHAAIANRRNADRLYAISYLSLMAYAMLLYLTVPLLTERMGIAVIFAVHAIVCIPGVLVAAKLIDARPDNVPQRSTGALARTGIAALAAAAVFYISEGALWAYVERFGVRVGLSPAQVGRAIAFALFLTIGGSFLAYVISTRFGRRGPIVVGILVLSGMSVVLPNARTPFEYVFGVILFQVAGIFVMIYITAFLGSLDSTGRVVAAAPASRGVGNTAGPAIAGVALAAYGYELIGWIALAFYLTALLSFLCVIGRSASGRQSSGIPPN